jgi:hypothetical protein
VLASIDAHLHTCPECRRWFRDDDEHLDPCPTMQALHDEFDGRVPQGQQQ